MQHEAPCTDRSDRHGHCLQAVPRNIVASVSSAEVSLCSFSELIMLGIAAVASDPGNFGLLVMLSSGTVVAAAVIFSLWAQQQPCTLSHKAQLANSL